MQSGEIPLVEDAPGDVEVILFGTETLSSLFEVLLQGI
jgi:hypothetical protein